MVEPRIIILRKYASYYHNSYFILSFVSLHMASIRPVTTVPREFSVDLNSFISIAAGTEQVFCTGTSSLSIVHDDDQGTRNANGKYI